MLREHPLSLVNVVTLGTFERLSALGANPVLLIEEPPSYLRLVNQVAPDRRKLQPPGEIPVRLGIPIASGSPEKQFLDLGEKWLLELAELVRNVDLTPGLSHELFPPTLYLRIPPVGLELRERIQPLRKTSNGEVRQDSVLNGEQMRPEFLVELVLGGVVDLAVAPELLPCCRVHLLPDQRVFQDVSHRQERKPTDSLDQMLNVRAAHLDDASGIPVQVPVSEIDRALVERSEHIAICECAARLAVARDAECARGEWIASDNARDARTP